MSKLKILTNGILKENPVLVLVLGTCPTLAVTTMASNALGMGAAATFVLLCSNIVISALRKIIPDKVRIPCYIVLIAGLNAGIRQQAVHDRTKPCPALLPRLIGLVNKPLSSSVQLIPLR